MDSLLRPMLKKTPRDDPNLSVKILDASAELSESDERTLKHCDFPNLINIPALGKR